jgi:nitroreductase/NAD-dependent dihydropyrimidine dehydrogenase PreA subunit
MRLLEVDENSCNRDGICAAVCPMELIELKKGGFPAPTDDAEDLCIRCGHCVAACPTGSLLHREMPAADFPPVREDYRLTPEHSEYFLRSRRSIRTYKKDPVSREDLARLIDVARYAPSGHNSQCVEWLVIDNRAELEKLVEIVIDWTRWMIRSHPELAAQWHMDRLILRWEKGVDVILRGAPAVIAAHAHKDNPLAATASTIALTYLELAAAPMGLGCCWAGYFRAAAGVFPPMKDALALPEGHECLGAMMVGRPKFAYHRLPPRKTPPIIWRG